MSNLSSTTNVSQTGESSTATISNSSSSTTQSTVSNSGTVNSSSSIDATTGSNTISENTTVTGAGSGNITVNWNESNKINEGAPHTGSFSSSDSGIDQAVTSISGTGAGSTTSVSNNSSRTITSSISNAGSVDVSYAVSANTGGNTVSNNTQFTGRGGGDITISINTSNSVNSPTESGVGSNPEEPTPIPLTPVEPVYDGVGGDFLPLPQTTTIALANQERYVGAGADTFLLQGSLLIILSLAAVFGKKVARFLANMLQKGGVVALCLLLTLGVGITPSFAADESTSNQVGPQGPVGPQEPVGPQDPVGPQNPVGPPGPTGVESAQVQSESSQLEQQANTASGQDAANSIDATGSNSSNGINNTSNSSYRGSTTNDATINNDINATLTSGNNESRRNTNGGKIESGDITGNINVLNLGNAVLGEGSSVGSQSIDAGNAATVALTASTSRTDISNTGANSANNAVLQGTNTVDVVQNSSADITNTITVAANTGDNRALQNTNLPGGITSGDINLAVNALNFANAFMPNTQVKIDTWSVMLSNPNAVIDVGNTGANSVNAVNANQDTTQNVTVSNIGEVTNGIAITATTGDSAIERSTNSGAIIPGEIDVDGKVVNIVNSIPTLYLVNIFGDWNGSLQGLPASSVIIQNTGAGSDNSATTDTTTQNYTLNNDASVNNFFEADLNTGRNRADSVTNMGDIRNGNITARFNFVNMLNVWNLTPGQFNIGIINIFAQPAGMGGSSENLPLNTEVISQGDGAESIDISLNSAPAYQGVGGDTNSKAAATPIITRKATSNALSGEENVAIALASATNPLSEEGGSLQTLADFAPFADTSAALQEVAKKRLPLGMIILGLVAGLWLGLELLANAERRRA